MPPLCRACNHHHVEIDSHLCNNCLRTMAVRMSNEPDEDALPIAVQLSIGFALAAQKITPIHSAAAFYIDLTVNKKEFNQLLPMLEQSIKDQLLTVPEAVKLLVEKCRIQEAI